MKTLKTALLAWLMLLLLASAPALAGKKSKFGFGMETTVSGMLSPKLKRIKVSEVQPGSPAASAGLKAGDMIIEANGTLIAGAPAREMAARFKAIKTGQHLRLKVQRGNQALADIDIVAGPV